MKSIDKRIRCAALGAALCFVGAPFGTSPPVVQAAGLREITLVAALERALAANPDLASATRGVEAAAGQVLQGRVLPNPQLAFQMQDTRADSRTTSVLLNQTLELGGERAARMAAAGSAHDLAEALRATRQVELEARVGASFHALLAAQQGVHLAEQTIALAGAATTAAAKRVRTGKIPPLEADKARVAEASARAALARAQSALANARQALAATWGEPDADFGDAVGDHAALPAAPTRAEIDARVDSAPSMQGARSEIARREALVDFERARRTPDVTLSLGVQRDEDLGLTQAVVGLAVPLPLFDRNHGNLVTAAARTAEARDDQLALRNRLRSEAYAARERLVAARSDAQALLVDVLPGARMVYEAAITGFKLGKFSFLEVLDAQRTLIDAQSRHVEAVAAAHQAAADIQRLIGTSDTPATSSASAPEEHR